MASLSDLPDEIIILIAEACDVSDKAHLARSNRRLNDLATSVLLRYSVREEGNSAMYWAAEHGHINTLEKMRACGAELNDSSGSRLPVVFRRLVPKPDRYRRPIKYSPGFLPLHVAAKFGQYSAVKWLLMQGARIESLAEGLCSCSASLARVIDRGVNSPVAWTPLHIAICNGNLATAKLLISHGAAVRFPKDNLFGQADVLHTAALCNNVAAIEFLVGTGLVGVDEPDITGCVALCYACLKIGNLPAVRSLLDLGASMNPEGENEFDLTPITLACKRGFFEAAVLLLDKGALVNIPDERYKFMFDITLPYQHFARWNSPYMPLDGAQLPNWERHREDFIRRLARLGVSFDKWYARDTILTRVAEEPRSLARTLEVLLDIGFDVNAPDSLGRTAVYFVLGLGDFDPTVASKLELLLRYGARLDIYTDRGYCAFDGALEISRTTGDASVIDFIFQHGSVANFGVGYLDRVVAHSYDSRLYNECRLLIGHGAALKVSDEQLDADIRNGIDRKDLKQLNFHLDHLSDQIKPSEMLGMALKHYKDAKDAKDDEMEVIKDLLARPEFNSTEPHDASRLLHFACKYHLKVSIAQLLLEKCGGVNNFDSDWETPLSYAVNIGCRPMVKYLLLHGANPHLAPSDQDWDTHVRKSPPGYYPEHLAFGDTRYRTPFMRALDCLYHHTDTHESCQPDANETIPRPLELMLQHMPLPTIPQDPHSLSYIHYALVWPDSLRILLEKGTDPNSGDHCTRPPLLHFLTMVDRLRPAKPEALRILLEFGADIHRTDGKGRSFLTMMRRCTLAMANNALFEAELENEQLGFVAGLLVRNFFITLDAKSGEDCVRPRPEAVADANYHEYLDRVAADYERKRQLELCGTKQEMGRDVSVKPPLPASRLLRLSL